MLSLLKTSVRYTRPGLSKVLTASLLCGVCATFSAGASEPELQSELQSDAEQIQVLPVNNDASADQIIFSQLESQQTTAEKSPVAGKLKSARPLGKTEKATSGSYVMQLILSLLVVLAAFAGLAWLVKRFNRLPGGVGSHMRVLSSMSLGARERAVLVQVGDTQMLLGVSQGRVATLHVFDEQVVQADDKGAATANSFGAILGHLGRGGQS